MEKTYNPYETAPKNISLDEVPKLEQCGFEIVSFMRARFMDYEYWLRTRNETTGSNWCRWVRQHRLDT